MQLVKKALVYLAALLKNIHLVLLRRNKYTDTRNFGLHYHSEPDVVLMIIEERCLESFLKARPHTGFIIFKIKAWDSKLKLGILKGDS